MRISKSIFVTTLALFSLQASACLVTITDGDTDNADDETTATTTTPGEFFHHHHHHHPASLLFIPSAKENSATTASAAAATTTAAATAAAGKAGVSPAIKAISGSFGGIIEVR